MRLTALPRDCVCCHAACQVRYCVCCHAACQVLTVHAATLRARFVTRTCGFGSRRTWRDSSSSSSHMSRRRPGWPTARTSYNSCARRDDAEVTPSSNGLRRRRSACAPERPKSFQYRTKCAATSVDTCADFCVNRVAEAPRRTLLCRSRELGVESSNMKVSCVVPYRTVRVRV